MTVSRRLNRVSPAALASILLAVPATAQQASSLEFAFSETVELGEGIAVGATTRGDRTIIPITGGTFEGPGLRGTIIPGGWDWQLVRADGCRELEADYFLKTHDGAMINVVNKAVLCSDENGQFSPVRTQAVFEPPLGKYQWLGQSAFVGILEAGEGAAPRSITISFYRVR